MDAQQFENIKLEIVSRITSNFDVKNIILFGSYAYGEPNQDSDVDIIAVLNENGIAKNFRERMERKKKVTLTLVDVMKRIPLDVLVYSKDEWQYLVAKNSFYTREILEKGIPLV